MKYQISTLITLLISSSALAASTVDELNVLGDTATFVLSEPKTHTIPNCVSSSNQNKWAINLSSLQGQAMYSLLVTAISKEKLVSVKSAERCESIADVEQVQSLSLSSNDKASSSGTWLYKGDGLTKVGKVVTFNDGYTPGYTYVPLNGTQEHHSYKPAIKSNLSGLLFLDSECKTEPFQVNYGRPVLSFFKSFNAYLTFGDTSIHGNRLADHGNAPVYKLWGGETGCHKEGYQAYQENRAVKLVEAEHPLCGKTPCWIK